MRRWGDGDTIADLMTRFERNDGGITSRLVRLEAAASREDIRAEDEKRRKARPPNG